MKRIIALSLIIAALMMPACTDNSMPAGSTTPSEHNTTSATTESPIIMNEPPSGAVLFDIHSYDQLSSFWGMFDMTETDQANDYGPWYGDEFTALVNRIQSDNAIMVPMLKSEQLPLRHEEGLPTIMVFTSELYKQPWIWYYFNVDGYSARVCTMYLDNTDNQISDGTTASDFIKEFSPTSPNLHNKEDYPNIEIYDTDIPYNGGTVTALIYNDNEYDQVFAYFLIDELLVYLCVNQADLDMDWAKDLSFVSMPLTAK